MKTSERVISLFAGRNFSIVMFIYLFIIHFGLLFGLNMDKFIPFDKTPRWLLFVSIPGMLFFGWLSFLLQKRYRILRLNIDQLFSRRQAANRMLRLDFLLDICRLILWYSGMVNFALSIGIALSLYELVVNKAPLPFDVNPPWLPYLSISGMITSGCIYFIVNKAFKREKEILDRYRSHA